MIVSIRLSIPDSKIAEVWYHAECLKELAKPGLPGVIDLKFPGQQGLNKTTGPRTGKRTELEKIGELFS